MFQAILEARPQGRNVKKGKRTTSVVQVRIQGAKGVISEDPTLVGSVLQLRPSMVKFEANDHHDVEIARSFDKPVHFFLNRPLVMILSGLGVPDQVFLDLQRAAVKEADEAIEGLKGAASLLETHGMGVSFALPSILLNLQKLGLDVGAGGVRGPIQDPFLTRSLKIAVHHVLREIKHRARVPVPGCWKLVGIVDLYGILNPTQIYGTPPFPYK